MIYNNGSQELKSHCFGYDDFIGAGIIYIEPYKYKIFFTRNGLLIPHEILLETEDKLVPMIGLDYSANVLVNFGNTDFIYNFRDHLIPIVISTKNKCINNKYDMTEYRYSCNLLKFHGHIKTNNDTYISIDIDTENSIVTDTESDSDDEILEDSVLDSFEVNASLTEPLIYPNDYIELVNNLSDNVISNINKDVDDIITKFKLH